MNYFEMVQWLNEVEPSIQQASDEVKQLFVQRQNEVFTYEMVYLEILINGIQSEINQIDYLNQTKEINNNSNISIIVDEEINRHKSLMSEYEQKISKLYSKANLINSYEAQHLACQERIEYSKRVLDENPEDTVSKIAMDSDIQHMKSLDITLTILTGKNIELLTAKQI